MKYVKPALYALAGFAFAASASAQTVGIGSTKAGAVAQITATISKAVSEHAPGVQMRKQTMGGTQQYIPVINAGELDYGIANIAQYYMAVSGTGLSKPTKYKNLRLVTTMMEFTVGLLVPKNAGINKISDLRGRKVASGFKGAPLFANITAGALATDGLTYADVKKVPIVGLVQHWRAMMEGKIVTAIAAAGTAWPKRIDAKVSGGIKYLSFPNNAKSLAAMHKYFPKTKWSTVKPRKGLTGVNRPVTLVTYDFMLFTHKGASAATVYNVAKVMHQRAKQLKQGGPLWRSYRSTANLAKNHGLAYHPSAIKYYKEAGLWKR